MEAKRDVYGVPGMLAHGKKETVAVRATEGGSLCVTDNKELLQVVRLALDTARENEQVEVRPYNEITVNVLDAPVQINFTADEKKTVSIVRPMSITVASDKLMLNNAAAKEGSMLEIWLWG